MNNYKYKYNKYKQKYLRLAGGAVSSKQNYIRGFIENYKSFWETKQKIIYNSKKNKKSCYC